MTTKSKRLWLHQQGAATLLIALVLMISITIGTLAVARTQLVEQKIAVNDSWNTRLSLHTEAGLAKGLAYLNDSFEKLTWTDAPDRNRKIHKKTVASDHADIQTQVLFSRSTGSNPYIAIQATSYLTDNPDIRNRISQSVRPLSILAPLAESVAPLVVNGCLQSVPLNFHIRAVNADSNQAGDAIWFNEDRPCPGFISIDIHSGLIIEKPMGNGLWPVIFSIDFEEFAALREEEKALPSSDRRYWIVQGSDLRAGRWHQSLGSAQNPIVLYFPPQTGCPEFSAGVRIYGVVYIDADCPQPVADYGLEVFGSLIVNGDLNIHNTAMQLNHIQIADNQQTQLNFPILRSVPVPGSWKDF